MAFNVLSGSIAAYDLVATGSFSGSYAGDGAQLINVKQFELFNAGDTRIPFYKLVGGEFSLDANSGLNVNNGVLTVPATTASAGIKLSNPISGTLAGPGSYLGINSNGNLILTSSSGGGNTNGANAAGDGGTIGDPEDGGYTDGLFTDLASTTTIGTVIDRFNEIFKILAPSPAPALDTVRTYQPNGAGVKMSFGFGAAASGYTNVDINPTYVDTDLATPTVFGEVLQNAVFAPTSSTISDANTNANNGIHFRLGAYANQAITGTLNYDVGPNATNGYLAYASGAFGNAETGSLTIRLNNSDIHTIDLGSVSGAGNPGTGSASLLNAAGSGFLNLSVAASSFDGNGAEWAIFKHRTGKFVISPSDQVKGNNYVHIRHSIGSTHYFTNFLQWVNDPDGAGQALSVSNSRIEGVSLVGSKYLSGVQYNTDLTASYKVDVSNMYRNVYPTGNVITFNPTNSDTPSAQSVPNVAGAFPITRILGVTASVNYNGNSILNGTIGMSLNATHPLKANLSSAGSATITGMLVDNRTLSSTNLIERFHDETYRKTSGSYNTQASVINSSATWNSQNHMTGGGAAGHTDGLIMFNQRLYSPVDSDIPNAGNFSSLANASSGQPNYSSVTGNRTFYRVVSNSSGVTKRDIKITTTKSSTTFNNSGLGNSNMHLFVKIPEVTGWMDATQNFTYGSISDGNGALINGASNDTDSGNNTHHLTFGTASVANGSHIMVKMIADESWAGYISQMQFQLGATTNTATQAPVLDDIDANNTGVAAKLSFGASNGIPEYSNATGSSISLTNFNSNDNYTVSGDRRGIFSSKPTITGELNEDVGASGNNYPANGFRNGYTGSLVLEVNGSEVHSINIGSTLNAFSNNFNGNSSGFSVSAVSFSTTSDNIPDYTKPYRTGDYQIGANDQNIGWNYARVIHRIGASDTTTNYVEWIVDVSGSTNDTEVSSPTLNNFDHNDVYYQSGIGYFASRPSASFNYLASNFYRNVYYNGSDAVTFGTTTNCSISNLRMVGTGITTFDSAVSQASMAALNNSADCERTSFQVTGTVLFDNLTSISGGLGLFTDRDVTVASTVKHVSGFKSNRTTASRSKTSFMVYSGSIGSTNLNTNEYFNTENYRIVSGNYANQASVTTSGNSWVSSYSMNDTGNYPTHADGAVTVNGYMISPLQIGNDGDTRNVANGGSLQAPANNPNYSSGELTNNIRTFYRYFRNETGLAKATFTLTLYGDANLISKSGAFYTGALGANKNIQVELKVPFDPSFTGLDDTSTAWGDCIKPYGAGTQPDADGVGIFNGGGSDLNQSVGGSGRDIAIQLQGKQVRDDQYFIVKISAHKDWTGYLSRIKITY